MCPLCFIKFSFLTKWYLFKNYEKCFLFHLKTFFCCRDIQIFVFSSSPLFSPVQRCLGGWSMINHKVYDVIICLNKNLRTHFAWYLGKEKRYGTETLPIDRVLNKAHVYGKIMQKMCTKNFLLLVNISKQPLHARNYFENKTFWKIITKKP